MFVSVSCSPRRSLARSWRLPPSRRPRRRPRLAWKACLPRTARKERPVPRPAQKETIRKSSRRQRAIRPGVTDFTIKSKEIPQTLPGQFAPEGNVKNIRTDVGPGESTNPEAVKKCAVADFEGTEVEPAPSVHAFTAPNCPESVIGTNRVTIVIQIPAGEPFEGEHANVELEGKLYNLEQPNGLSAYFGVALNAAPLFKGAPLYFHTFLEGHIEWGKEVAGTNQGDYHDIYIIKNVTPGLIRSRIDFTGNIGAGGFLTLPSSCTGTGPQTTTTLHVESYEGESASKSYSGPLGTEGCNGLSPFVESSLRTGIQADSGNDPADQPDGITTELNYPTIPARPASTPRRSARPSSPCPKA